MVSADDLRNGVLISKPSKSNHVAKSKHDIWDKIAKLEKKELCMECERRKWKSMSIKVCSECSRTMQYLTCCHCKLSYANNRFCVKANEIYKRELCMACAANWATYNCEPKLCRLCNRWSAWRTTSECDTCFELFQKYGEPATCETCGNNAAFDRGEQARQRVNNLRLCFLCTYNYKKNDYYNKKLMMSRSGEGSKKSDDRTPKHRRTLPVSDDSTRSDASDLGHSMGEQAESERNALLLKENKDLKESLKNLTKRYTELQEEVIQLNKKLKVFTANSNHD